MSKKITFDVFIRSCITIALCAMGILLINHLSGVLIPFFVALLLAYMLNPFVTFFQVRCRLRHRMLSILVTLLLALAILAGFVVVIVQPLIVQTLKLMEIASEYVNHLVSTGVLPDELSAYILNFIASMELTHADYLSLAQEIIPRLMNLLGQTANFLYGFISVVFTLLYLVFILVDYENITKGWVKYIPWQHRRSVLRLFYSVKDQMQGYFRGQSLIAFIVGVLFAIGFTLINFPLAIGLGLFIGLLNLVPYLQTVGLIPTVLLALMEAADTGQSFWVILLQALIVFAVVQAIQDAYLTPRIMGKQMGLNPAVILLSLSVWGTLLGIIGLIIALPLTSLLKAYYNQYLERQNQEQIAEVHEEDS